MKQLYIKKYKQERINKIMVEKPFILFYNDLNIANKHENTFRAKLKEHNWSIYKTSHQQIGTFHGSITLLCGWCKFYILR